ncbi:MAG: phosphatase PAP2 family protein [Hyphomicrobiales bacterium]|nr:phosphatase PAP2 family protein [Hyphomicrobiales bacterium]
MTTTYDDDVDAVWRLFCLNWLPLGAMGSALGLAVACTGFSIEQSGLIFSLAFVAVYAAFAHANARSARRRDPQVMFVLGGTAQVVLVTVLMAPLTYVAASAGFPLQDGNLLLVDRMLGLDWKAYVLFVNEHPTLASWLSVGYNMIRWPIFAIPVLLAAVRQYRRMQEFTFAFGLALIVTTVVSGLVPALGVYQEIGLDPSLLSSLRPQAYLDQLRDLEPVRDGVLRHLDLFGLAGIVTFPSFHAASAILYTWALWPVRWMRPIAILANGAMLASTPIDGGHYFIDLAAGIAIAVLAIAAARALARALTQPASMRPLLAPLRAE